MQNPVALTDDELRAWDWKAALKAEERGIPWLARRTGRAQHTVYRYSWGTLPTPIEWLRAAAAVLRKDTAA